jgi:hypothetical protein
MVMKELRLRVLSSAVLENILYVDASFSSASILQSDRTSSCRSRLWGLLRTVMTALDRSEDSSIRQLFSISRRYLLKHPWLPIALFKMKCKSTLPTSSTKTLMKKVRITYGSVGYILHLRLKHCYPFFSQQVNRPCSKWYVEGDSRGSLFPASSYLSNW